MPKSAAELLAALQMKTTARPRYAIDPDRQQSIWCPRPGEQQDNKISAVQIQLMTVQAAEAAHQTDALQAIAAALVELNQTLKERNAPQWPGCPSITPQPLYEIAPKHTPSDSDGST